MGATLEGRGLPPKIAEKRRTVQFNDPKRGTGEIITKATNSQLTAFFCGVM
jgi:hypothetical protein